MPHESPLNITIPLMVLALLGIFGGHFWLLGDPMMEDAKSSWFLKSVSYESVYGHDVAE